MLSTLDRTEQATAIYDEVVKRFGTASEPVQRELADVASNQSETIPHVITKLNPTSNEAVCAPASVRGELQSASFPCPLTVKTFGVLR